jgi:hypothetical protein
VLDGGVTVMRRPTLPLVAQPFRESTQQPDVLRMVSRPRPPRARHGLTRARRNGSQANLLPTSELGGSLANGVIAGRGVQTVAGSASGGRSLSVSRAYAVLAIKQGRPLHMVEPSPSERSGRGIHG